MSRQLEDTLERTAKIISQRSGAKVICKGSQTPQTNGQTIFLPSLPSPCPQAIERVWHGVVDHELGHVLYSDFDLILTFKARYGELGFKVLNALEDLRVERLMKEAYPGAKDNLDAAYRDAMAAWERSMPSMPLGCRAIGCLIAVGNGLDGSMFGADAMSMGQAVIKYIRRAPVASSPKEIEWLAVRVMARWRKLLKVQGEEFFTQHMKQLKALLEQNVVPSLGQHLSAQLNAINEAGEDQPYRIYDRSLDVLEKAPDGDPSAYRELLEQIRPHVAGLRQRLLMGFRSRAQKRWVPCENGSLLNRRKLHTLCMDAPAPAPLLSKTDATATDVAVSLLIDQSGSMRGERIELAQKCALLLAETMDKLSLPLEVIGCSTVSDRSQWLQLRHSEGISLAEIESHFTRYLPLHHVIYKEFGEPLRKCRGRFSSMKAEYYTPLNESVLLAGKRLLAQKASRRVLVVLTDGKCYVGSKDTVCVAERNLRENVAALERSGVETVGVGIMAPYVSEVFHQSALVNELGQLPETFFKAVSRKLVGR